MKYLFILFFPLMTWANATNESFIIQISDREMKVISPDKARSLFSVIIENGSLSNQVGRFMAKGQNLKFVSVLSGKNETVEIENKTDASVIFVPISPAFQDVELRFGKKVYEIPAKN